jgi:hypothetical protein
MGLLAVNIQLCSFGDPMEGLTNFLGEDLILRYPLKGGGDRWGTTNEVLGVKIYNDEI